MKLSHKTILVVAAGLWLAAIFGGGTAILHYTYTPGGQQQAASQWPAPSSLRPYTDRHTLVMALHPKCTCSRASLVELNQLSQKLPGKLGIYVLVMEPSGAPADWAKTDTVASARRIPGAQVVADAGGLETGLFGAQTSGQVMLYGEDGRLLFNGGITAGRGHLGENPGYQKILTLVEKGGPAGESRVFGCPLTAKVCPVTEAKK